MSVFAPRSRQRKDGGEPPAIAGVRPMLRRLPAGATLFHQGDRTVGIFYLQSGCLRMQRVTPDGGTVLLHLARAGEAFAEASLFSDRYHCDAIAECDCAVWQYGKKAMVRQLRADPALLWDFAAELARGLRDMRQRYELKQIRSAPERVLQFLRLRCDGDGVFRPETSLKEISVSLGLTHEAFYRAVATLEKERRIERKGGLICLLAGRARPGA